MEGSDLEIERRAARIVERLLVLQNEAARAEPITRARIDEEIAAEESALDQIMASARPGPAPVRPAMRPIALTERTLPARVDAGRREKKRA